MKTKKKLILLWCVILLFICFIGCKPTPDKAIVVNKADGNLQKIIGSAAAPAGKYQAPSVWKETAQSASGHTTVNIEAIIKVPEVREYTVLRISPADITQEQADEYIDVLMRGKPIYIPKMEDDYTKEELTEMIITVKESRYELELIKDSDPDEYAASIEAQNDIIEYYEKLYQSAPDEFIKKPANGKFQKPDASNINLATADGDLQSLKDYMSTIQYIHVAADLGKPNPATLHIFKNSSNKQNSVYFENYEIEGLGDTIIYEITDDLPNRKKTLQEALSLANAFLDNLGINYMEPVLLASKPDFSKDDGLTPVKDLPRFYSFVYTRTVGGIPTVYVNNKMFTVFTDKYNEDWPEEQMIIDIDDTGILSWSWTSPSSVIKTENANVPLLPFNEIQEKAKQQLILSAPFIDEVNVISNKIHIDKITLGMTCIQSQNNDGEYLLVPVWDFFGYSVTKYKQGCGDPAYLNENNEMTENELGHSYLTINAIDGSIIHRS
ncbi:MAG: DUF6034 family protein [Christensenellales bacterium]